MTLYMFSISVVSLSFFFQPVLEIPLFFLKVIYNKEGLLSSLPWWLKMDVKSFSTLIDSKKLFAKVLFYLPLTNITIGGGKSIVQHSICTDSMGLSGIRLRILMNLWLKYLTFSFLLNFIHGIPKNRIPKSYHLRTELEKQFRIATKMWWILS